MTAVRQNFARSECIPIDQLYMTQEVVVPPLKDVLAGEAASYGEPTHPTTHNQRYPW